MTMAMAGTMTAEAVHSGDLAGPQGKKPRRLFDPARILIYTVLIVAAIFYLFPLYVMIITSVKDLDAIRYGNLFVPTANPSFEPWIKAWDYACTGLYCEGLKVGFWNSVKITVPSVIVSIAVASVDGLRPRHVAVQGRQFLLHRAAARARSSPTR